MAEMDRYTVEHEEKWRDICKMIPAVKFHSDWEVKVLPPFGGAMARFWIEYIGKHVSVYLDTNDNLGVVGQPYYEAYPIDGDARRCYLNETDVMMEDIAEELGKQGE